jgi:hypothetical protein
MSGFDISALLPPYLNLPPHLSAHKYFFVCTLTVAAWDTLVLSPRSWRLMKTKEWPVLKIVFQVLRYLMPAEFIIVGQCHLYIYSRIYFSITVIFLSDLARWTPLLRSHYPPLAVAFFDTKFTQNMCDKFYLFEPICTMILIALCAAVHVIRIHAIYDKSRPILAGLSAMLLVQVSLISTLYFYFFLLLFFFLYFCVFILHLHLIPHDLPTSLSSRVSIFSVPNTLRSGHPPTYIPYPICPV